MAAEPPVYTVQPFWRGEDHTCKWYWWGHSGGGPPQKCRVYRVRGEEEDEAVSQSQETRLHCDVVELSDSPLTGRKSAAMGDKRCGSRIFCLPAWLFPTVSASHDSHLLKSIHLGTGLTCTESVLSPASWLHHGGSRSMEMDLCLLPASAGLMCSPGLV